MSDDKIKNITKIKSLARNHTERAISVLAGIMDQTDCPPASRVAAAQVLLDRGWGKPTQPIAGDEDAPPVRTVTRIERLVIDPGDTADRDAAGLPPTADA